MYDDDVFANVEDSSCTIEWNELQLGTDLDDQIWGVQVDQYNNIYINGFEYGLTGVSDIEPAGNARGVVFKLSPKGAVRWKAELETNAADTIEHVAIDPRGGQVYAVGRTSGALRGFVNKGQFDGFLVELDARGRATKILQWGDERPQHPVRLSLGLEGELAVVGSDDMYIPTNYVEAFEDGFVASFDRRASAEAVFTQNFLQKTMSYWTDRVTDVAIDRDGSGSMYVTSYVGGLPEDVGIFVKKLNGDGSLVWSKRISNVGADMITALALSPSNELFVTGATFQRLGAKQFGQQDAFVLKVDRETGHVIWAAQAGSIDSDYPTALGFDDAGNIYIAGDTLGSVSAPGAHQGGSDIFVMKFDPAGALLSVWQRGTTDDDSATSMAVDHCGRVFVGAYSRGPLATEGRKPAGHDMFIVRAAL